MAAWLGWMFDGLDGYLYILIAAQVVQEVLGARDPNNPVIALRGGEILAAFLGGWALGGVVFGYFGDRYGRKRALQATIITYSAFTAISAFSPNWQTLCTFRFLAGIGVGGEWAAGASLVTETWPKQWRPLASAVLQSAFQVGLILAAVAVVGLYSFKTPLAALTNLPPYPRVVFLVGLLPALFVVWVRYRVPESEEWLTANETAKRQDRGIAALFRAPVLKTTLTTIALCSVAMTTYWAMVFWSKWHLEALFTHAHPHEKIPLTIFWAPLLFAPVAIFGNFLAGILARKAGYRTAVTVMFVGSFVTMIATYQVLPRLNLSWEATIFCLCFVHVFVQGVFGLFPLYIPPLFPTIIRNTGAGFSYNIGRIVAALAILVFVNLFSITRLTPKYFETLLTFVAMFYIAGFFVARYLILDPPSPGRTDERIETIQEELTTVIGEHTARVNDAKGNRLGTIITDTTRYHQINIDVTKLEARESLDLLLREKAGLVRVFAEGARGGSDAALDEQTTRTATSALLGAFEAPEFRGVVLQVGERWFSNEVFIGYVGHMEGTSTDLPYVLSFFADSSKLNNPLGPLSPRAKTIYDKLVASIA